jgi:hypothetical protein
MTLVHSGVDEFRKSFLLNSRGVEIVQPFGRDKRRTERLGNDQVSDTESGKYGTRKCTEVNYAAFRIETLHGLERAAFILEFAIVIVFDND